MILFIYLSTCLWFFRLTGSYFYIFIYLFILLVLYSHLHVHAASQRYNNKDRRTQKDAGMKDAGMKDAGRKTQEDFFNNIFRVLETEHKLHILTPLLWPSRCVFLVLLDAQPEVLGSTPSGLFRGPPRSGVASLPHLVSNSLEVSWQLLWHPTQLNYIIIQRPHDRPLDLWNRMFNRHQAEITVMQFRGYSLPVHHCSGTMGPSPCPIS